MDWWWYVGMIFVKTDLHLGVLWGLHGLLALKGRRSQPWPFSCEMSGQRAVKSIFLLSVYMMCFSPMVSAQRTCCCSGSWELELISPGWDTELHCYKPSPDVTAIVMVTEHALQCQQLSKVFSFSLRFVLHTEYKLSSCWGWSERSY